MLNAIDFMIKAEEDGLQLYEMLSREAINQELKDMFALLADSQKSHLMALQTIKSNLSTSELASMEVKAELVNGFDKLLNRQNFFQMLRNDQDAFWHVVTTEEEIISTLEGLASNEPHDQMRRVLERVVADEKEHLNRIENIYEFMEAPLSYLAWGEFSNLRPL
ncbi:MAG TPA: ferritin family protein [Desulfuromonadaceae bacterium]|jgi:rubrerythrin